MIAEVSQQTTDDVWILYGRLCGDGVFSRVPTATRGRDRERSGFGRRQGEVPVAIEDTNFTFQFRVANVTTLIVSAEEPFQAGCTAVITKIVGFYVVTPSGLTNAPTTESVTLEWRISTDGELEVLSRCEGFHLYHRIFGMRSHKQQAVHPINWWPP